MTAREAIDQLLILEGNQGVNTATLADDGVEQVASDRGGRTKWGITQGTYDGWRQSKGLPTRAVDYMPAAEMYEIYEKNYWIPSGGGRLPDGLDYVVFQAAVNCGVAPAVMMLQEIVGTVDDGIIGPVTIQAAASLNQATLIKAYLDAQRIYYDDLVSRHPDQYVNLQGWYNRITKVAQYLIQNKKTVGLFIAMVLMAVLAAKNSD